MFDEVLSLNAYWSFLYGSLAILFGITAFYFDRRTLLKLSGVFGLITLVNVSEAVADNLGSSRWGFLFAQMPLLIFALAPALHSDFVISHYSMGWGRKWVSWGYFCAISAAVAQVVLSLFELDDPQLWLLPYSYLTRSPVIAGLIGVFLIGHFFLALCAYQSSRKQAVGRVVVPLIMLAFSIPFIIIDFWLSGESGINQEISEAFIWLYGLVHLGVLLSESRGQKGLLKRTAESLVQTTQELQFSNAELEHVQSELEKKEQLAIVGELAAAIAHEVRNPLAVIKNAVSGLRRRTISAKDQETLLCIVDEEAEALNQLVSDLLRFARPIDASCSEVSLSELLQELVEQVELSHEVVVTNSAASFADQVWVDSEIFKVAVENILLNAEQSMVDKPGGRILISVNACQLSEAENSVCLSVLDEGPGMSQEQQELALKPFYSTQPKGSGLGLPIAERIVQANAGQLLLSNPSQGGCLVKILIPLLDNTKTRAD